MCVRKQHCAMFSWDDWETHCQRDRYESVTLLDQTGLSWVWDQSAGSCWQLRKNHVYISSANTSTGRQVQTSNYYLVSSGPPADCAHNRARPGQPACLKRTRDAQSVTATYSCLHIALADERHCASWRPADVSGIYTSLYVVPRGKNRRTSNRATEVEVSEAQVT